MFLLTGRSPKVVRYLIARCDWDYVYRVSGIQATCCCKEHGVRVLGCSELMQIFANGKRRFQSLAEFHIILLKILGVKF